MTVDKYQGYFTTSWHSASPLEEVRFVVLDTETTGTDPRRDRLISIGGLVVQACEIRLDETFEVMLKVAHNAASVTVHGITRDEASGGFNEASALELFLDYLRDGVIVGHHIGHDIEALSRGTERNFGFRICNRSVDTMDLTLHLKDDGAFAGRTLPAGYSLDALCEMFGVIPHDRHTAGGDAFITAQIFLRLISLARRMGRTTMGQICEPYQAME